MPLTSGTKLGPYEIQSPLGAGGMGEVYRARDTRLDRTVAVKILPAHLSDNPEAKQRFDREARAISSLNHPNICTLHDVGHQDGIDFLVMECLEGETLADRLRKGPLPLDQVFRYGIEICDGLEKAHRSGVIHRDLKPGNIMLTKTGAKLMDFGLAKASVANPAVPTSNLSVTMSTPIGSHPLTQQGTVVGTFQYMSPEQVEGKEADDRSDIFALGAVLYEMSTGKRAFEGKTAASVMAAVLERDPAPISSIQPVTPPAFERLVKTCLAKDPDERWQTAHDVKLQLKQIAEGSQSSAPIPALPQRKSGKVFPLWIAGLLLSVAASALILAVFESQKELPVLRVSISPPPKTQFNVSGDDAGPAVISPDGRYLVFSAISSGVSQLYLRPLDSVSAQPLLGTEGANYPFWSPDSRSIAFFTPDKLKRVEVVGAAPVTICESSLGRGGSWGSDGTIVAALSYNAGISRVPASGGAPTPVTKVDRSIYSSHRWPWFLPDGKHFLYNAVNHSAQTSPETAVFFASLDGKENRLLFHTFSSAIYGAGHLLFMRDNSLVAQPFDPANGKFTGDPLPLAENVQYDSALWRANLSVSTNGTMVYASGTATGNQVLTWFDRTGKSLGTVGELGYFQELRLSPDNKKLAVVDSNTAAAVIWIYDLASNLKTRLTFNGGVQRSPTWSPDGRDIAFTSNQQNQITVKSIGGGTPDQILMNSPDGLLSAVSDWSRDGRYLLFEKGIGLNQRLWVLPLFGDHKPYRYTDSPGQELGGVLSPDGRWVAYTTTESGHPQVFVAPFPWTGAKWEISGANGLEAIWRPDGKELYYFDLQQMMAVGVDGSSSEFHVGSSKPLFRLGLAGLAIEYAVTRDGQRLIAITPAEGNSQALNLVQNWPAELKKK
jgi:serine/threonine protein kinase